MSFSVRIIDKAKDASQNKNKSFLWSPRSLQLLNSVGVSEVMLQEGFRHWKFETFANNGHGSHAANADHQSYRVWENEVTEFNWSLSYECNKVCDALIQALNALHIKVEYQQELINLEDGDNIYLQPEKSVLATIQNSQGEISYWKSRILIGADGKTSFVRHKLGIAQRSQGKSGVFYTLEATVTTNFTGTRMSVVTKGEKAVFIVGHGSRMYFMFEHQPRWSHLTIDDHVPIEKAQRHIKAVLDPYQVEFIKVHAYFSWSAECKSCEEYGSDRRFFLVGGAAQSIEPPGLLSTNLGLEQAQNLCWKLYLHLHQRASPLLLDTYEEESRSKLDDVLAASQAFVQLIGNRSLSVVRGESHQLQENTYKLQKNQSCLVGQTPYQTNLINLGTASNFSLAISECNTITAAAQMVQHHADSGAVGSLAPNARLKPYTMIQILLSQSNVCPSTNLKTTSNNTVDEFVPPPSPISMSPSPVSPTNTPSPTGSRKTDGRPRSLSSTPSTSSGWSLAKLQTVTKKAIHYYSGEKDQQQRIEKGETPLSSVTTNKTGTMTASSNSVSTEGWKRIRPNYFHLLDKMGWEYSEVSFTILVFCGNIHDNEKCLTTLRKLRRYLDSNNSFIHRYETHHQHHRHSLSYGFPMMTIGTPSATTTETKNRSSISSFSSSFSNPTTHRGSNIFSTPSSPTSMHTNMTRLSTIEHRPSFSSTFFDDDSINRNSTEDTWTTPFLSSSSTQSSSTRPLFSFLYVTSSSKNEVSKCLSSTPSAVIHAAFPFGLDKVYLDHDHQCHIAYNSNPNKNKSPTMVVIRPDGYIGARVRLNNEEDVDRLDSYFDSFLRPHYDQNSAAALIAASFDDDC